MMKLACKSNCKGHEIVHSIILGISYFPFINFIIKISLHVANMATSNQIILSFGKTTIISEALINLY